MSHHKYQYVVLCRTCGIQPLEYEDYLEQLKYANSKWTCPVCGQNAQWDDNSLETDPPDCPHCLAEQAANEIGDTLCP